MARQSYRKAVSYHHKGPFRRRKRKPIHKNRFFWMVIGGLFLIFVVFCLSAFLSAFQIKEIRVAGSHRVAAEDIQTIAFEKARRKVMLFPSRSIFFAQTETIRKELLESKTILESVVVNKKLFNTLIIQVKERQAVGIWCRDDNCFDISQEGIIFARNEEERAIVILSQEENKTFALGEQVMSPETLGLCVDIEARLARDFQIKTEMFLVNSLRKISLKASEGWEAYFDPTEDLGWQSTKLVTVLEQKIPPGERRNLEYLDLRFGDQVYPKYR